MVSLDMKISQSYKLNSKMEKLMGKDLNGLEMIGIMLVIFLIIILMEEANTNLQK